MECGASISDKNDKSMRRYIVFLSMFFLVNCNDKTLHYLQLNQVKLAPPPIIVEAVFFDKNTNIKVLPPAKGSKIYYTTDGTQPSKTSMIYQSPIEVTNAGTYQFISIGDEYIPSEVVKKQLFAYRKIEAPTIEVLEPSDKYPGSKQNLFDGEKGAFDFRNDRWTGFEREARINIWLGNQEVINGIVVSSLVDHNSWIFGPEEITMIYVYADGEEVVYSENFLDVNENSGKTRMEFSKITTGKSSPEKISIHIKGPAIIPSWHPGSGKQPWLFLDEIVIL